MEEWIKNVWFRYTEENYSALRRKQGNAVMCDNTAECVLLHDISPSQGVSVIFDENPALIQITRL